MITPGWIAGRVGRGMLAGLVGTAAMTASSTVEMRLRGRPASVTPAKAVEKIMDIDPETPAAERQLASAVHWGYGALWGGLRGMLDAIGIRGLPATILHLVAVWGAGLVMLPALRLTPPVADWSQEDLAIDGAHHTVYAVATGFAYDVLLAIDRAAGKDG